VGFGPQFADLDGDGLRDVASGSYLPGDIYLFRGAKDGAFRKGIRLRDARQRPVRAGFSSAVNVVDWDGDGDPDLVVGCMPGDVTLLSNRGSREGLPVFEAGVALLAGQAGRSHDRGDSAPLVVDWDGDGLRDLLVGYDDGSVQLHPGLPGGAIGETPRELIAPCGMDHPAPARNDRTGMYEIEVTRSQRRAKLAACDWNGDGRLDLLVGDYVIVGGPEPELSADQTRERQRLEEEHPGLVARVQQERSKLEERAREGLGIAPGTPRDELQDRDDFLERVSELVRKDPAYLAALAGQERAWNRLKELNLRWYTHGYVWVYLRKAEEADAGR